MAQEGNCAVKIHYLLQTLSVNIPKELAASIMRHQSRLGAAKRQLSRCFFVFPYYKFDLAKPLLGTQGAAG